jgi:hypothetical protein
VEMGGGEKGTKTGQKNALKNDEKQKILLKIVAFKVFKS